MKRIIVIVSLFLSGVIHAQPNPFMNDGNGQPLFMKINYRVEGSPYLFEDYRMADVYTLQGKLYKAVRIKIDLVNQRVQYMDNKGQEMISVTPVRKIIFESLDPFTMQPYTLVGAPETLNRSGDSLFQVLDSGRLSLFKQLRAEFRDEKKYGEAGVTRIFTRNETYFVQVRGGERQKLSRNKKSILAMMSDKADVMQQFISRSSLNPKDDDSLIKLFHFYNSLF